MSDTLDVLTIKSPFRAERDRITVPVGLTLGEIIDVAGVDPYLAKHALVFIGEENIPRENWSKVRPRAGHQIAIRAFIPPQGGQGGKDILRTVLLIAVAASALAFAPALGAALGLSGALALAAGQAIIGIGGMLLVNALVPPRTGSSSLAGSRGDSDSATKFIEGARNQAAPFAPVPVLFGRRKIIPQYGAQAITEIVGDDQYLRMLFVWGIGPMYFEPDSYKIGDTLLSNFEGVQVEHFQGLPGDTSPTLYPDIIDQDSFSITLLQVDGYTIRTSSDDADELSVDLSFLNGLISVASDGTRSNRAVQIEIEYSVSGAGVWNNIPVAGGVQTFDLSWTNQSAGSFNLITFTQKRTNAIRHGLTWKVPTRGQYDVRIKRITADNASDNIRDEVTWTALRRITIADPINSPVPVAKTALRIKASDQLNSVIDEFSAIALTVADEWNGSAWVNASTGTRNPGALFRNALQGKGLQTPKTDDQIDLETIEHFSDFCRLHNPPFHFDQNRDFTSSLWDLLSDIAAAGRASPTMIDGKYSLVIDEPKTVMTHITPRNSFGFKMVKAFVDAPDAIRVQFNNELKDFNNDELRVYLNGHTRETAETFETMDFPGVTHPDQNTALALFNIACAIQRPETWTLQQDMERLVYRRGDMVNVTHDVLLVGLASGRIKSITTDGSGNAISMTVDETLTMETGKLYGVSIRNVDNVEITGQILTVVGDHNDVSFANPIPAANVPDVGDLFGFGELGREKDQAIILSVEPNDSQNLSASISLIPYRSEVYDADTTIPPFDSKLTTLAPVPAVVIQNVRSDESVLTVGAGNSLNVNISVKIVPLTGDVTGTLETQIRTTGTAEPFTAAQVINVTANEVLIGDVRTGESVDMRFRWLVPGRLPGAWTAQFNYLVLGKSTPPNALIGLTISTYGGQAFFRWQEPSELDVLFGGKVLFRHSADASPSWGNSTSIGQSAQAKALYATLPLKTGTYMARVYDEAGNQSDVVMVDTTQASVLTFTPVDAIDEAPTFSGTKTNTTVSGIALRIGGGGLWDDIPDVDAVVDIDTFGGSTAVTSGEYEFDLGFDFLTVKKVRLTVRILAGVFAVNDNIDSWTENVDLRADFDGSDSGEADCIVYVSQTNDDPAVTPTWSSYERLDSMEVHARGCRFKAVLTSYNQDFNIDVTELGIDAEEVL